MSEELAKGLVLYTDGGCHQKTGHGGWGVHGYVYVEETPKKGSGCSGFLLTKSGYIETSKVKAKEKDSVQVTPISYVDMHGSLLEEATNNTAELEAYVRALQYVLDNNYKKVHIVLDSEYVLKGATSYLPRWAKNGWAKADGQPIANVMYWRKIYDRLTRVKEQEIELTHSWVKGHAGNPGNVNADKLATYGLISSVKGISVSEVEETAPEGYWKNNTDKTRLFGSMSHIFLGMGGETVKNEKGYYPYYLYSDDNPTPSSIGVRNSDACYAVLYLKDKEPAIEEVKKYQKELVVNNTSLMFAALISNIYKPAVYDLIINRGTRYLYTNPPSKDIKAPGVSLTQTLWPPRMVFMGFSELEEMHRVLERFLNGTEGTHYTCHDITPNIYEAKETKKKVEWKISSEIPASATFVDVTIPVPAPGKNEPVLKTLRLVFGIELPKRPVIQTAAKFNPEAHLIVWPEADGIYRFYFILKTDEGIGIWGNPYRDQFINR